MVSPVVTTVVLLSEKHGRSTTGGTWWKRCLEENLYAKSQHVMINKSRPKPKQASFFAQSRCVHLAFHYPNRAKVVKKKARERDQCVQKSRSPIKRHNRILQIFPLAVQITWSTSDCFAPQRCPMRQAEVYKLSSLLRSFPHGAKAAHEAS